MTKAVDDGRRARGVKEYPAVGRKPERDLIAGTGACTDADEILARVQVTRAEAKRAQQADAGLGPAPTTEMPAGLLEATAFRHDMVAGLRSIEATLMRCAGFLAAAMLVSTLIFVVFAQ